MEMKDKIKYLRESQHLTLEDIGKAVGVGKSTVRKWETGDIANMRRDKIAKLAAALHTTPAYLMGWADTAISALRSGAISVADIASELGLPESVVRAAINSPDQADPAVLDKLYHVGALLSQEHLSVLPSNILPMPHTRRVPRLGQIACGTPITAEENFDGFDDVPEWVRCDFTLTCKGDSMINARIYDGDIVCIRRQDTVETGEIAAVLVDSEATLKRVRLFDDHIVLEAENPTFRPLAYWGEEMSNVHIIGKATHFISAIR